MATGESKLLKNLAKLGEVLDGQGLRNFTDKTLRVAHGKVGVLYQREAVQRIQARAYKKNRPLTKALKGSDLPLVADSDLVGSITHKVIDAGELQMGAVSPKTKKGQLIYRILEEGATIRVTPKMRRWMMWALSEADNQFAKASLAAIADLQARGVKGKAVWIIPPRPFLTGVFASAKWQREANAVYVRAMSVITRWIVRQVQ